MVKDYKDIIVITVVLLILGCLAAMVTRNSFARYALSVACAFGIIALLRIRTIYLRKKEGKKKVKEWIGDFLKGNNQ